MIKRDLVVSDIGNEVRFLQFLCYKSVDRKRIVETSGNRLKGEPWCDYSVKIRNSVIINRGYDLQVINKSNYQSDPRLVTNT
jgi:hypothetical protein